MSQSPKGRLIQGLYKPIDGNCAIYFYPGVTGLITHGFSPTKSVWGFYGFHHDMDDKNGTDRRCGFRRFGMDHLLKVAVKI